MQFIHRFFTIIIFVCLIFTADFSHAGSAGTLDTSFDSDGIVITDNNGHDIARGVAIQSDGKIVIVGTTEDSTSTPKFIVCRYNADGSLDTTFDTDGIVITDVGGDEAYANAVAIQSDGKIVVAGKSGNYGNSSFTVVRYTTSGALDGTFATGGIATTQLNPSTHNMGRDMVIQSDGKIIVIGVTWGGDYDFGVVRFTTTGSLDTSFDSDGKRTIDFGDWDFSHAVALQTDGKIILAGRSRVGVGSTYDFALARLTSSGALDTSFDTDGLATSDVSSGSYDSIESLAIQDDGKILAAGLSYGNHLALARYTDAGILDTAFATNGVVSISSITEARSIVLQFNGKIVAAGNAAPDFGIARFTSSGSLDTSFSSDGILIQSIGVNSDAAWDISLQSDGKIVAVGESNNGTDNDIAIIRVNSGAPTLVPVRMLLIGN